MQISIIGNPFSGKTLLFKLLSDNIYNVKRKNLTFNINKGKAKVFDKRIKTLSEIYNPEKTTYPEIEYIDIGGLNTEDKNSLDKLLNISKESDLYLLVIAAFNNEKAEKIINSFINNFILLDLDVIEKRIERISSQIKKQKDKKLLQEELIVLNKIKQNLINDIPIYLINLKEKEKFIIKGYQFYSEKRIIPIINISESYIGEEEKLLSNELTKFLNKYKLNPIIFSIKTELEISQLDPKEKEEIMQMYNIKNLSKIKIINESYKQLNLITFFTTGKDEVKGWPIKTNTPIQKAAGKIHTDLEKGFIKAIVINYKDFIKYKDMKECYKLGLVREEGKNYIVKDGDIITVKFNI